ncbi:hypothetical protein [Nocardia farcinica]|uniref:Uncharacterized protein n=1 Tax=Nocardia farcinica (strain IFM 10152) TaxID=247156 RepID=Q5YST7_NOCFA|nr:hypothetical protein [Nocardia farcinica]BAD58754.1 hypothetical protein NFA_39060 [Nocardia farcinica IFM 10152]
MTAPNQPTPDGSIELGAFRALQTSTAEDVQASLKAGAKVSFTKAQNDHNSEVKEPIAQRPTFAQTPVDMAMWSTMNPKEHCSFPRSQLIGGTAGSTGSGGSGDNPHSHNLTQTPDYQPDGNEGECAFIRMQRDAKLRHVGFATGDNATFLGVTRAHIGVYKCDQVTGTLTLLTPALAAANIQPQVTTQLTEFLFDMGVTITAKQDEIYAVILLQIVSGLQAPGSYLGARIKKTGRWNGTKFPYYQYCWTDVASGGVLPSSLPAVNQHWNNDPMTVPFVFLREE